MENEIDNKVNELLSAFESKYDIDQSIVTAYINSVDVGDMNSLDAYSLILFNLCPKQEFKQMKKDLKEIVHQHIKNNKNII